MAGLTRILARDVDGQDNHHRVHPIAHGRAPMYVQCLCFLDRSLVMQVFGELAFALCRAGRFLDVR